MCNGWDPCLFLRFLRFGALAKVVNKGEAPPSLVALLLQFLEAPDPPDPEPEEETEVATIYEVPGP